MTLDEARKLRDELSKVIARCEANQLFRVSGTHRLFTFNDIHQVPLDEARSIVDELLKAGFENVKMEECNDEPIF